MRLPAKLFLSLFLIIPPASFANNASIKLSEGMSFNIQSGEYFQNATYEINNPGYDGWVDNGVVHTTDKMPSCLIVIADKLDRVKLDKFLHDIKITTWSRELSLEFYKGTLIYVDRDPFNSHFMPTPYIIETRNNLTFGQLLKLVGGTEESMVSIEFNRGCRSIATRAFLPAHH